MTIAPSLTTFRAGRLRPTPARFERAPGPSFEANFTLSKPPDATVINTSTTRSRWWARFRVRWLSSGGQVALLTLRLSQLPITVTVHLTHRFSALNLRFG